MDKLSIEQIQNSKKLKLGAITEFCPLTNELCRLDCVFCSVAQLIDRKENVMSPVCIIRSIIQIQRHHTY